MSSKKINRFEAKENYRSSQCMGCCPICREVDGRIEIGHSIFAFCKEHKTRWCIGRWLTPHDEDEDEQRRAYQALDFSSFADVMPFFHGAPQEPGVMLAVHSQTGEQRLLWSVGTTDWRTWREPLPGCDERAN